MYNDANGKHKEPTTGFCAGTSQSTDADVLSHDWPLVLHMLGHIYNNNLCDHPIPAQHGSITVLVLHFELQQGCMLALLCREDARFLWKRVPDAVKQQVRAGHLVLQAGKTRVLPEKNNFISLLCCAGRMRSWQPCSQCSKPSGTRGIRCVHALCDLGCTQVGWCGPSTSWSWSPGGCGD